MFVDKVLGDVAAKGISLEQLTGELQLQVSIIRVLAGGFVLTSLIWASALAAIIDRKLAVAATCFAIAAGFTLFGVIHSPLPGNALFLPWQLSSTMWSTPLNYGLGYLSMMTVLLAWHFTSRHADSGEPAHRSNESGN